MALCALVIVGGWSIENVNVWLVFPDELVARRLIVYRPLSWAAGVPDIVAAPAVGALNVMPAGSAPWRVIVGVGVPVAVTVKVPATPAVKIVDAALVIMRLPLITVSVSDCTTLPLLLVAVIFTENVPTLAAVMVPTIVAVPSPLSVNVTPAGNSPDSVSDGAGYPSVVSVNEAGWPTVKLVEFAEVIAGEESIVSVNAWVVLPRVLLAVIVIG